MSTRTQLRDRMQRLARLPPGERRQLLGHYLHAVWCWAARQDKSCPYCGAADTTRWGKDAIILQIRECRACRLRFTWPKTGARFNRFFYNWLYDERGATDLPPESEIPGLLAKSFRGTLHDLSGKIEIVRALVPAGKVLDYGCSWGYGTWQLAQFGYDATGFEPSVPRAEYGRKNLGIRILGTNEELDREDGLYDAVFTSHVFEHLPNPGPSFDRVARLLKPGGWFIGLVPNCDGENARREGLRWGPMYGMKHVLSLDHDFFARALPQHGFESPVFFSEPYDPPRIAERARAGAGAPRPGGDELLFIARRKAAGR